jgi:hypothetical protein
MVDLAPNKQDNTLIQVNETNCENISSHSMPSMSFVRGIDIVQGGEEWKVQGKRGRKEEEKREKRKGMSCIYFNSSIEQVCVLQLVLFMASNLKFLHRETPR